jgi:hypothetical protein
MTEVDTKLEAIRAAAQAELASAPRVRPWWLDALVLVVVNVGIGVGLMAFLTPHLQQHTSLVLRWAGAAGLLTIASGGAVAAIRPGARSLRLGMVGLAIGSALVLLAAASGLDGGKSFFGGAGCGALEGAYSVVPVVVSTFVLSRFAPDVLRTLVAGLSAGAGGLVGLHLHCENGALSHLVGFHLVPWALVSVVALGVRRLVGSASYAP